MSGLTTNNFEKKFATFTKTTKKMYYNIIYYEKKCNNCIIKN
jgi:hypothetical protein